MPSYRLDRTNDDIQRVLSELLRAVKDPRVQQGMISVTHVETTGDLKYAKVYLSVLGLQNAKEFRRGLKSASGWLRREVGGRLSLRNTPELIFELDNSLEHGAHINELLSQLNLSGDAEAEGEAADDEG